MGDLLVDHAGLRAMACGPVFMNAWMCPPTIDQLDRLYTAQIGHREQHPQHLVLSLVDPRVGKVMDGESRARAKVIADDMLPFTLGHCYVVLGTGFLAAMARSVITGIQLVGRYSKPWKVVATIPEGCAWTAGEVGRAGGVVAPGALEAAAGRLLQG